MARTTPVHNGYTVVNGAGTGTNGNRIDVWVEYYIGAYSVDSNTTPFTAYFYAALNPGYASSTSSVSGLNSSFTVDGASGNPVSNGSYDFRSSSVLNLLGSYSGNITHDSDGTKSITISGSFTTTSSWITGGSVAAFTVTLPTIPRASTIKAANAQIGAVSTVTVKRNSDSFTHSIAYQFGSLTGYITGGGDVSASEVRFEDTTISFTVPEAFYTQIPSAPSGGCTLICRTYSGSSQIGTAQSCTFTATAAESLCKPVVAGTVVDVNEATLALTGDSGKLVRYMSTALCTISAQAQNSATLVSKFIGGAAVDGNTRTIGNMEAESVAFSARDSRGYPGDHTEPVDLIPYIKLTNNASAKRTDPTSGNARLTFKGNYFRGSFGAVDNSLTVSYSVDGGEYVNVEITPDDGSYETGVDLTGLDYQSSHSIKVIVADALETVTKTVTVGKGIPVFDWGENDFAFHVPVVCKLAVSGVFIRTVRLSAAKTITLQSRFAAFDGNGDSRQSVFLFGNDNGALVSGVIGISNDSSISWAGTSGVSAAAGENGLVNITLPNPAFDSFALISPEEFEII